MLFRSPFRLHFCDGIIALESKLIFQQSVEPSTYEIKSTQAHEGKEYTPDVMAQHLGEGIDYFIQQIQEYGQPQFVFSGQEQGIAVQYRLEYGHSNEEKGSSFERIRIHCLYETGEENMIILRRRAKLWSDGTQRAEYGFIGKDLKEGEDFMNGQFGFGNIKGVLQDGQPFYFSDDLQDENIYLQYADGLLHALTEEMVRLSTSQQTAQLKGKMTEAEVAPLPSLSIQGRTADEFSGKVALPNGNGIDVDSLAVITAEIGRRPGEVHPNTSFLDYPSAEQVSFAYGDIFASEALQIGLEKNLSREQARMLYLFTAKIIWHESRGDALAVSPSYCLGIGQLYSGLYFGKRYDKKQQTWQDNDQYPRINPFNPTDAIPRSMRYIYELLSSFDWDEQKAATAYNAGPGAVKIALEKGHKAEEDFLPYVYRYNRFGRILRNQKGNPVPNKEAQQYFLKVQKDWENFLVQQEQAGRNIEIPSFEQLAAAQAV